MQAYGPMDMHEEDTDKVACDLRLSLFFDLVACFFHCLSFSDILAGLLRPHHQSILCNLIVQWAALKAVSDPRSRLFEPGR